ncbi:hypothetical protein [Cohnella sp.]
MNGKTIDRDRLNRLLEAEILSFEDEHPRSKALFERAKGSMIDGVPMN